MCNVKVMSNIKFWTSVAVVVIFYFLSWGPVSRIIDRWQFPTIVEAAVTQGYLPCRWLYRNGPQPIRGVFRQYTNFWFR